MKSLQRVLVVFFVIGFLSQAHADGLSVPNNYDECILKNMKGVNSDVAARAIADVYKAKFPEPKPPRELSSAELKRLRSEFSGDCDQNKRCSFDIHNCDQYKRCSFDIHNRNTNITITQIRSAFRIYVNYEWYQAYLIYNDLDEPIPPMSEDRVSFDLSKFDEAAERIKNEYGIEETDDKIKWVWEIIEAKGY